MSTYFVVPQVSAGLSVTKSTTASDSAWSLLNGTFQRAQCVLHSYGRVCMYYTDLS